MLFGAHESVAGGVHAVFGRAQADACRAIQVFTKNSNQWKDPVLAPDVVKAFRDGRASYGAAPMLSHASYLINLATDDAELLARSVGSLAAEVERSSTLGIDYVVLHPGAHLGAGEGVGVERVAEALDAVHDRVKGASARILLENTAGQGTCIGHRFEHLRAIFDRAACEGQLGLCIDTQHSFAAGYDLASDDGYENTWRELEALSLLHRVCAFHINDSKKPLGSRVDRHEHVGEGLLGLRTFWRLANDERFKAVPAVLETEPRDAAEPYKDEVALLNGLVGATAPAPLPAFALELVEAKPAKRTAATAAKRARSR
jgi:deoxyribonuclease-4